MALDKLRLRRFRIQGYKSLTGIDVSVPGNLLFLIGANGAGKSAVLQALAFVQYFARGRSEQFFEDRGWKRSEVRSRISGHTRKPLILEIFLQGEGVDVYWRFSWSLTLGKLISESIWTRPLGGQPTQIVQYKRRRPAKDSLSDDWKGLVPEGSVMAVVEPRALSPECAALIEDLRDWGAGVTSLELLSPVAMRGGTRGVARDIGVRGERLASFLASLDRNRKDRLVRRLSRFYPLEGIDTTRKRAGWIDLRVAESYRGDLNRLPATHMSDGFMRILALSAIPEFGDQVSLILLDEVEDGIEPHILPHLIRQVANDSRAHLLMTSHSPLLINFFDPNEICFLSRADDGRTIVASSDEIETFKTGAEFLGSGEIWANVSLDTITGEVLEAARRKSELDEQKAPTSERVLAFMEGQ